MHNDGYIECNGTTWVLGTSSVEKVIVFSDGMLTMRSFKSKVTGQEMIPQKVLSEEFAVTTSVGAEPITGATRGWHLVGAESKKLSQGELQLDITLQRESLQVTKSYVVYPGSSLVREWITFKNTGDAPVQIIDPSFLNFTVKTGEASATDFMWMSGGDNKPGSWKLYTELLSPGKPQQFDSYAPPRVDSSATMADPMAIPIPRTKRTSS
jgi:hypothetical protein